MGRRSIGYEIQERYAKMADLSVGSKVGNNPKQQDVGLD
jgi:hypothetical protein